MREAVPSMADNTRDAYDKILRETGGTGSRKEGEGVGGRKK